MLLCRQFHSLIVIPAIISLWVLVGSAAFHRGTGLSGPETNSPPVAVDDSYTVHGGQLILPMTNDYDPDNDPFSLYTFTPAQHGTVTAISSTTYSYTAAYAYVGPDSFTYTVRDLFGNTATATGQHHRRESSPDRRG